MGKRSEADFAHQFAATRSWRLSPSRTYGIDAENQCLINHKCVCGALNRQFLVGAVLVAQLIHTAIIVLNILCTKMLLNVHKCLYVKYIQDFRLYLYHARAQRHSTQNDVPGKYQ